MLRKIGITVVLAVVSAFCLEAGGQIVAPGEIGFTSTAGAVIGRPLSPVSVAGVARRSSRRCAAGVTC
jgi:hypothetical protein